MWRLPEHRSPFIVEHVVFFDIVAVLVTWGTPAHSQYTLLEKIWWISLFVTDDAIAKLYVT